MRYEKNVSAKHLSTYGGKGVVSALLLPESKKEFVDALSNENCFLLGGGSNTLILDGQNNFTLLSTKGLDHIECDGNFVKVDCGVKVSRLVAECRRFGLGGLEFLSGVPATIGGAVKMNAGAFGTEIGVYVAKITTSTADGEIITLSAPFDFSYRKGFSGVIVDVTLCLDKMTKDKSLALEKQCLERRHQTQPKGRSVGCTFKNTGLGAGFYIDKVGLKGLRIGGAEISKTHANFIVNLGDGSADDFLALVDIARKRVFEHYGLTLENEFKILGEI